EIYTFSLHDALPIYAHEDHVLRALEVDHLDELLGVARGEERGLVDEVGEVGAGEPGSPTGKHLQVDGRPERDAAGVDAQDLLTALDVGPRHHHLTVEAPGAEERRV